MVERLALDQEAASSTLAFPAKSSSRKSSRNLNAQQPQPHRRPEQQRLLAGSQHASLAQLEEQRTLNPKALGSIPRRRTHAPAVYRVGRLVLSQEVAGSTPAWSASGNAAERTNAPVSKPGDLHGSAGSNPAVSSIVRLVVGRNVELPEGFMGSQPKPHDPHPHRLANKDAGLSRRKHGFESRWGYQEQACPHSSARSRAPPCQGGGRRFKSGWGRNTKARSSVGQSAPLIRERPVVQLHSCLHGKVAESGLWHRPAKAATCERPWVQIPPFPPTPGCPSGLRGLPAKQ